jgi:hypothetical protein
MIVYYRNQRKRRKIIKNFEARDKMLKICMRCYTGKVINEKMSQRCRKRKELCAGRRIGLRKRYEHKEGRSLKNIHDMTNIKE